MQSLKSEGLKKLVTEDVFKLGELREEKKTLDLLETQRIDKIDYTVQAKNEFEEFCFLLKKTTQDKELMNKFEEDNKQIIANLERQATKYLEDNPEAKTHDYE